MIEVSQLPTLVNEKTVAFPLFSRFNIRTFCFPLESTVTVALFSDDMICNASDG